MKKLFFAICFIVFSAVLINPSNAAIKQMRDEIALQQYNADKSMQIKPAVQNRNIPTSFEAFRDFIRERAQKVEKMPMSLIQSASTMNVMDDAAFIASQKQEKSTFEKIYASAMERLTLLEFCALGLVGIGLYAGICWLLREREALQTIVQKIRKQARIRNNNSTHTDKI